MWDIRKDDFEHAGVAKTSFVYRICEDSYNSIKQNHPLVLDDESHMALRKMSGVGLYLMRQKRNGQVVEYNNPGELLDLIEHSKSLKQKHPKVFEKYRFDSNLKRLAELQQETPLKGAIQKN